MGRFASLVAACTVGMAVVRADHIPDPRHERVLEGTIFASNGAPVSGARILFGPAEDGLVFQDGATATSDDRGRFRADLSDFPWSSAKIRAMILSPGFKATECMIEAGATTIDARLESRPWKGTVIRTKDASGRAVAGVVIACKLSAVMWETLRSDSEGRCRISMAPAMSFRLSAAPEGARPLDLYFGGTQNEPEEVDLPILPPVRGRVVDPTGHPLPGVAVGRWVTFQADGSRSMIPFWGGSKAETDSDGRFSISPMLTLKASQTDRERDGWLSSMAFAGPGLPRIAVRTFRPLGPVDPIEIVLEPTRRVRVPIRRVPIVADAVLSSIVSIRPQPNADLIVINRPSRPSQDHGKSPEADLVEEDLPPGRYHLEVVLRDSRTNAMLGEASRELVVGPGEGPVELPPLLLDLPSFRKMAGQAAPEIEATDLDGRPSKLADLRGRVVVLDFWGYWCGPCIWELPNLARLQEEFEGRPLTIVALHDGSARSRVEYHQKTAMARERIWGGRELPLKVLLDRHDPENDEGEDPNGTGATIRRYGITKFPTTLVIDHEGKMVGEVDQADHARLASLLKSLMERAEAPGKK